MASRPPAPTPAAVPPAPLPPALVRVVLRRRAWRLIGIGALLFVIGIVITAVTYQMAADSSSGGLYLLMYGPIVGGVITAIRGVVLFVKAGRQH